MSSYKGAASEGGRAQALLAARRRSRQDLEQQKRQMEADTSRATAKIDQKFASKEASSVEQELKQSTYGEYVQLSVEAGCLLSLGARAPPFVVAHTLRVWTDVSAVALREGQPCLLQTQRHLLVYGAAVSTNAKLVGCFLFLSDMECVDRIAPRFCIRSRA